MVHDTTLKLGFLVCFDVSKDTVNSSLYIADSFVSRLQHQPFFLLTNRRQQWNYSAEVPLQFQIGSNPDLR